MGPAQAEATLIGLAAETGALLPQAKAGLNNALSNVGGKAAVGEGETGSLQPAATTQPVKTGTQAQAKAPAPAANTQAGNTQAAGTTVAAQAQGLADKAGNNSGTMIKVSVTNEANTLVSQPASNLGSASALAAATRGGEGTKSKTGGPPGSQANTTQGSPQAGQITAVTAALGQGQQANAQAALAQSLPTRAAASGNLVQTAQPLQTGGDVVPGVPTQATGNVQTQQAATPQTTKAARGPAANSAVTNQITVQITKAIQTGIDKLTIMLKPASLGRVEVQLEIAHDGRVSAVVIADNKDTLDLLQKDAKELARALADTGLQADSDSLSFNLRGSGNEQGEEGTASSGTPEGESEPGETETIDETLDRLIAGDTGGGLIPGRVDIRA